MPPIGSLASRCLRHSALLFVSLCVCPHAAVVALLYNILHIALMVVAVDGYRRWSWPWMSTPLIVHLAFGLLVRVRERALPAVAV